MNNLEKVIGGLMVFQAVKPSAEAHTHHTECGPRLCVREEGSEFKGPTAKLLNYLGWQFDADTSDWYFDLEEGC